MQRSSAIGLSSSLVLVSLSFGCRMANPAFGTDEFAGESSESGLEGTGPSESSTADESSSSAETSTSVETSTSSDTSSDTETSTSETTSDGETSTETDTGITCEGGLVDCGGVCVDLVTNPENCGECGSACTQDQVCAGECVPLKYVFVSSQTTTGNMGGVGAADELCTTLATEALLPGTLYYAWNSTEVDYPDVDFVQNDGSVYRRTDGQIIATSYEDLTDGSLALPINLDENQLAPPLIGVFGCPNLMGAVWSSTTAFGGFGGLPNCLDWGSGLGLGKVGSYLAFDSKWSQFGDCQAPCSAQLPIYCVQQDP